MDGHRANAEFNGNSVQLLPGSLPSLYRPKIPSWRADSSELGVFTAERYFEGGLAAEDTFWRHPSPNPLGSSPFSSTPKVGRDGSAQTPTATSSSEDSWNSQSALLPSPPAVAAAIETVASKSTEYTERKTTSRPTRQRLFRVACPCVSKKSVSVHKSCDGVGVNSVLGDKKQSLEADMLFERAMTKELVAEETTCTVRIKPGKWEDGAAFLAKAAACAPVWPAFGTLPGEASYHHPVNCTELTVPILKQETTNNLHEVATIECGYPPSEASVVWSVATAEAAVDGASVGNFSSAASGYYDEACRFAVGRSCRGSRCGGGGGLMRSCRREKAVSAVRPKARAGSIGP